jgi:hypothetical protein
MEKELVVQNNQMQIIDDNPQSLISVAIQKGVDINQLEKLLALKERYDAIQAKKSFLAAMSKFQSDVPTIQKKKQVGYTSKGGGSTSYKYADLGEIDEVIKHPLADNGLSKRWEINEDGEKIFCTCIISHVDGHFEKTSMSSIKDDSGGKNLIQSRASAVTYLQRYTLIGALGLTTASEDNDGDGMPTQPQSQNNSSNHSNNNSNNDLPWLNLNDRNGVKTELGNKIVFELKSGKTTLEAIKKEYKLSKAVGEELANIKVQPVNNEPFIIPGNWHAKMEKCKTKADVLAVYSSHKETVDAHPELQKLLKETQSSLKQ